MTRRSRGRRDQHTLDLFSTSPDDDTAQACLIACAALADTTPAPSAPARPLAEDPAEPVEPAPPAPITRWRPPTNPTPSESERPFDWPHWGNDECLAGIEGQANKFEANIAAITALQTLEARGTDATPAERAMFLRYTGWGGIPASFNPEGRDPAWRKRAQRLQQLLSAEDYEAAKASVNNAHYTDPVVVRWVWQILRRVGFNGGQVLEPSAGVGHFIGCMPRDLAQRSRITAVEIDAVSGRILKALYAPYGVNVRIAPFESVPMADSSVDLVVSNVPFGNYQVHDPRNRPYSRASIHNWFVGRALDLVRPGGLVCIIVSSYFMDARARNFRAHAAGVADLVTAFRLPQGAFQRIACTDVQTDLLVLRKRQPGAPAVGGWLTQETVPDELRHPACYSRNMQVNCWYVDHPRHVLGRIRLESNGYEAIPTTVLDGDLESALRQALEEVPAQAPVPTTATSPDTAPAPTAPAAAAAPEGARPGMHVVREGRLCIVDKGALVDVHERFPARHRQRTMGMVAIRDAARKLLDAQLADVSDAALQALRDDLHACYDTFVDQHGCLSTRANALAFRRDPDFPLLLSLEHYNDEDETARKADVFFKRTVSRASVPTSAGTAEEALALSMQWRGRVDTAFMADLLGTSILAIVMDLEAKSMIYRNPETLRYESADAYLSGNVRRKLQVAQAAGPAYAANTAALERVIPEDLPPSSITPKLGAVWVPSQEIEAFAADVLGMNEVQVSYSPLAGAWNVTYSDSTARHIVACTQTWGTQRVNAMELLAQALNVQTPTVKDPHPTKEGSYVVNKDETLAAREKWAALKEKFAEWAFECAERRERLCRLYNDTFNSLRLREFDGSHLTLPGYSQCYALHPSQLNAIWRIVQSGNTGLFHTVGAGKSAIMVIAGMELRRLGLASKPAFVVPNHCLEQFTAELVRCYPNAKVLMATKEDLERDRRRQFVSRVATGAWDAVVMTHSTFGLIPMSASHTREFIKDIIEQLSMAVLAHDSNDRSNRIIKELERMKKQWKARLLKLDNANKKDDFFCWEALGIDHIFFDEAHLAKNLWRHTKMTRIAGLPNANSQRAFDLLLKTRYTMSLHRGQQRGVVLATATPVANTMAEIHVFQRYLQPRVLDGLGLAEFDAWAATFGEQVTALELAPDGRGYRMNTRFARFVNVPDLMATFCEVSDVRTKEMLKLPVPRLRGGKPRVVTCRPSEGLKSFVRSLVLRAEDLRTKRIDPKVDNMLKITSEGRRAALDMRLVDPTAAADPEGKVALCAREVHRIWQETADLKRAQLVFCDLSTPKEGREFSVYEALRDELLAKGIPADQIAFIHDAETDTEKSRLFRKVREGLVRVLIGSTNKMGVGTNVQQNLVAQHDLDCPWRPCDIEQREGRILRQGNECEEVEILRYVTEGSFDAYSWQTVTTKAKFIAQVMMGDKGLRSLEDVELATLTYAEIKALASGNPLVIEKAGVDAEVAKYASLFSVWRNERFRNERELAVLPANIRETEKRAAAAAADASAAAEVLRAGPEQLAISVEGRTLRGPADIGSALREIVKRAIDAPAPKSRHELVGRLGGFELCLFADRAPGRVNLYLKGQRSYDARPLQNGPALFAELVDTLRGIEQFATRACSDLETERGRLKDLTYRMTQPFEHEVRLQSLRARQRELMAELDLDKSEEGTAALEATSEEPSREASEQPA